MIQLTFQAALDPFHAMFRLVRLRSIVKTAKELSIDHVRILDFYLTFPFRIDAIRLQQAHRKFRRLAHDYEHTQPYGEQPDDRMLFNRMAPMQMAAMETLASNHLLDPSSLRASWVKLTPDAPSEVLQARAEELNEKDQLLLEFLRVLATEYSVSGSNGLKHRTGLMEYRYDVV